MDALLETLNTELREWNPETAEQVRERLAGIIDVADHDALHLMRSRATEQEVLNLLDEPAPRSGSAGRLRLAGDNTSSVDRAAARARGLERGCAGSAQPPGHDHTVVSAPCAIIEVVRGQI